MLISKAHFVEVNVSRIVSTSGRPIRVPRLRQRGQWRIFGCSAAVDADAAGRDGRDGAFWSEHEVNVPALQRSHLGKEVVFAA
jgi:hypothetical protein